jgi:predicted metalloprotease with PDZ domain
VTVSGLKPAPIFFRMSRSSPGRYATHEFGKNVYNVSATDGNGKVLVVEKTDADVYKVVSQQGTVKLKYTLYGNYADGTYASIDASGYHLNMPAAFMWVKGLEKVPLTLQFRGVNKNSIYIYRTQFAIFYGCTHKTGQPTHEGMATCKS